MFTSPDPDGHLTGRPLTIAEVGGGAVSFLIDGTATWASGLSGKHINLAVNHTGRNEWVSVCGTATVSKDRPTIERLWTAAAGAYFDGKDDPKISVLAVSVDGGEYWDAPGGGPVGRLISVVGAALGRGEAVGDHGKVSGG